MHNHRSINLGKKEDFDSLSLPPEDLMSEYVSLAEGDEKKQGVGAQTPSDGNQIYIGNDSIPLSPSGEIKFNTNTTSGSGNSTAPSILSADDDEEDVKHGPGSNGRGPSQVPVTIYPAKKELFPTSMAAWENLQNVIHNVNDPLKRLEAKKLADRKEDKRTADAGGATRLWYKTTSFLNWACCGCLPNLCKSTFVLLTAAAVVGAALYLKSQANIADAYQAPDFHPGNTMDDSIYALGGITSDLSYRQEHVWPLINMERMGYYAAGVLGLVWTVEFFIYRYIHHQNEKTRQAGENTHQVTTAQTEVIRKLTDKEKEQAEEIKKLTQEIKALKEELKGQLTPTQLKERFKRLEDVVMQLTGIPFPPLKDFDEKTFSKETVSDGKILGVLDNTASETREGHTSDVTNELMKHRAKKETPTQASNPQSFVAGGGQGRRGSGDGSVDASGTFLNSFASPQG